ncbi:type I-F CRISPR-associated protein Csy2 [Candidatus Nitrosacidococcus tergens]|uniref:CRISPR-associated protein, Csy2 family n=1 Tax=Candidatus Nitrosacidococcus tergens TaxID=553981 RepID=A0A7G1Q8N7_9GAMM|nr:type I-F CRISPR-associated protein Csy2 [Candidatus Nitrosacidococcus tergens]CAB1275391.1 conserved protein of unknown function [Candidatus Nitrosacidococcus tergens]
MDQYYLLLPMIKITNINWESSHLTCSLPLTAIAGFADCLVNFELVNHAPETNADLKGFAVCLHEGEIYDGLTKNPLALCKGNGNKPNEDDLINPPIIPELKGHATLSLVIKIEVENKSKMDDWIKERANQVLHVCRIAGGDIIQAGRAQIFDKKIELAKAMNKLPTGWFIKDRAELIAKEPDPFKALIDAVAWFSSENTPDSTEKQLKQRRYPGWLYATCVGYQLLEDPQDRLNRSHGVKDCDPVNHAYAEPAHSLAELIWVRKLLPLFSKETSNTDDNWLQGLLWDWKTHRESKTVYLSAK